jgi:putative transposase
MDDVSLETFYEMLEYKCVCNDKKFVKIDRFSPSSKMCSNWELTLKNREWICILCGEKIDRDFNASKNILNKV